MAALALNEPAIMGLRFKACAAVVMFLVVIVILTVFESGWWRWLVVAAGVPISIWGVNVILEYESPHDGGDA